jgi:thiamine monophosphate kinase
MEEDKVKKQELISIEEQLYAKGIWKRPGVKEYKLNGITFSVVFDESDGLAKSVYTILEKNLSKKAGI